MELKEYLNIIKKHKNLFLGVVFVVVAIALGYFYFLPARYDAYLTLNITRSGSQETADYKYDDFYRLQADEKFAETVVEWLGSPRVMSDIYTEAKVEAGAASLGKLAKKLVAEKRSSQIVAVSFSADDSESAQKIAASIARTIQKKTADLNADQKESTWFSVINDAPIIVKYRPSYGMILVAALCLGIFLGFWGVLVKHYLE